MRLHCNDSLIYTGLHTFRRHASPPRAAADGVDWTLARSPREDLFSKIIRPNPSFGPSEGSLSSGGTHRVVAEKTGEWKKLENLVQNQSIGSIVGARHDAAPRSGRRHNVGGIMTIRWTSPPPILQIHSLHQVDMGTPSHFPPSAPCNNYRHFSRFWDQLYGPLRLGIGTEVHLWTQFEIYLIDFSRLLVSV